MPLQPHHPCGGSSTMPPCSKGPVRQLFPKKVRKESAQKVSRVAGGALLSPVRAAHAGAATTP
jgi:hypothetical protein